MTTKHGHTKGESKFAPLHFNGASIEFTVLPLIKHMSPQVRVIHYQLIADKQRTIYKCMFYIIFTFTKIANCTSFRNEKRKKT